MFFILSQKTLVFTYLQTFFHRLRISLTQQRITVFHIISSTCALIVFIKPTHLIGSAAFKSSLTPASEEISLNSDGTVEFEKDWAKVKRVESLLIQKINALFDMDDATELFATRNPFSSVGGKFFIENVLEVLGRVVGQAVEEEAKLAHARTEKYLNDIEGENTDDRYAPDKS